MVGSVTLSTTYGIDILEEDDPNMLVARRAQRIIGESLAAGSKLVDMMPLLKHLPAWFPGASFQKIAAEARLHVHRLREGIFEQAHQKWVSASRA